ncbi:hypothetical protein PilKf_01130 [Pillotina sp. SPG140]
MHEQYAARETFYIITLHIVCHISPQTCGDNPFSPLEILRVNAYNL